MPSTRTDRARGPSGMVVGVLFASALLIAAAAPSPAAGQEIGAEWTCFRSWSVSSMEESDPFAVDRSPWALRWRRTTPTHTEHDGLFAELHPVEDGEKVRDQVAAVNTDHEGHEGTVRLEETGTFWLDMETWSEETAWEIEACRPPEGATGPGGAF